MQNNNNNVPLEVQAIIEDLIRTADKHKIVVAGFVVGAEPPCLMNFGNCSDYGDIELYTELCNICDDKRRKGLVVRDTVGEVQ
jgi:hypothetical protein